MMQSTQAGFVFGKSLPGGLCGWLFGVLGMYRPRFAKEKKQLRLVESLPLGGRRQLMLVECSGELFLIGGGTDTVTTIVPLLRQGTAAGLAGGQDCR